MDPLRARPASRFGGLLLATVGALVVAAGAWIALAEVDQTRRFAATLEPARPDLVLQAATAGPLRLAPGALPRDVRAGERLGEVEVAGIVAALAELRAETDSARARLLRLEAEARGGAEPPVFPPDLLADAPEVVAAERALWQARSAEAAQRDRLAEAELAQHRHARAALMARAAAVSEERAIISDELAARQPLVASGIATGRSLEPYRRAEAEQRGEAEALGAEIARAEAVLGAALARRDSAVEARRAATLSELTDTRASLARLEARLPALLALLASTELRSPADGRLEAIGQIGDGAVIAAGQPVLRIRQADSALHLRARLDPERATGLRPGLAVRLRLPDPGAARSQAGRIMAISELAPPATGDGGPLVEVEIAADPPLRASAALRAGQTVDVAVLLGRQRVSAYLLGPLAGAGSDAFAE